MTPEAKAVARELREMRVLRGEQVARCILCYHSCRNGNVYLCCKPEIGHTRHVVDVYDWCEAYAHLWDVRW